MKSFRDFACNRMLITAFGFFLLTNNASTQVSDNHLILVNPTVKNLETVSTLVEKGIFPLRPGTKLLGLYHFAEVYDYTESRDFSSKNNLDIRFVELTTKFNRENIYGRNEATPVFDSLLSISSGMILFGGPDLQPALYNESQNLLTVISDPNRHLFEASLVFQLLGGYQDTTFTPLLSRIPDFPILAICLGMQTMNIATGGTLVQDIPTEVYGFKTVEEVLNSPEDNRHRNYFQNLGLPGNNIYRSFHRIAFTGSFFDDSIQFNYLNTPYVLSNHHQSIEKIGKDFHILATSTDGKIIEAFRHQKFRNVMGVQFHPELPDLFKPEAKFHVSPHLENESYKARFGEDEGELFHRLIWSAFSVRINNFFPGE